MVGSRNGVSEANSSAPEVGRTAGLGRPHSDEKRLRLGRSTRLEDVYSAGEHT